MSASSPSCRQDPAAPCRALPADPAIVRRAEARRSAGCVAVRHPPGVPASAWPGRPPLTSMPPVAPASGCPWPGRAGRHDKSRMAPKVVVGPTSVAGHRRAGAVAAVQQRDLAAACRRRRSRLSPKVTAMSSFSASSARIASRRSSSSGLAPLRAERLFRLASCARLPFTAETVAAIRPSISPRRVWTSSPADRELAGQILGCSQERQRQRRARRGPSPRPRPLSRGRIRRAESRAPHRPAHRTGDPGSDRERPRAPRCDRPGPAARETLRSAARRPHGWSPARGRPRRGRRRPTPPAGQLPRVALGVDVGDVVGGHGSTRSAPRRARSGRWRGRRSATSANS